MTAYYTTIGKAFVVDLIDDTASGGTTHFIGGGTGSTAASVASTGVSTEVSESRVAATKSQPAADTNQWVATQTYTATKTITNAGVFTASTSGTMFLIADGLSIAVTNGDSITFTFTLQQT